MFPSRAKFKFQIVPSDRQLWAIGLVVVSWTLIEQTMQMIAYGLSAENSEERNQFDQNRAFKKRLDLLEDMIKAEMRSPYREAFLALLAETRNAQDLRDKIVHNTWGGDGHQGGDARGVFNWSKPNPIFDWKLDFGGIKAVATRIDQLGYSWQMAIIEDEYGSNILMSEALQRKRRTA